MSDATKSNSISETKFMVTFRGTPDTFLEVLARYKSSYESKPVGFNILGFWHSFNGGYMLISGDIKAAYRYAASWSDLLTFDVEPVLDDKEAAEALEY